MICRFTVPLRPKAKERPRFTGRRTYTPKATLEFEEAVRYYYRRDCGRPATDKPVMVTLLFSFALPKSIGNAQKQMMMSGEFPYRSRPDLDNLEKAVMDALNTVAYLDDAQVVAKVSLKRFWEKNSITITIEEMEGIDYESGIFAGFSANRSGDGQFCPSGKRGA